MSMKALAQIAALACAAIATAPGLSAQGMSPGDPEEGAALYAAFCATCHGISAEGNGPTAELMTIRTPDLTRLAAANGGEFPVARIVGRIDGRDPLVAHGSPMPIFGAFFEGDDTAIKTQAGQPILTSRPVVDLVEWLRAIQVTGAQ